MRALMRALYAGGAVFNAVMVYRVVAHGYVPDATTLAISFVLLTIFCVEEAMP